MIVYKALRKYEGKFYSVFYGALPHKNQHLYREPALEYKVGEITKPKYEHSRLFVFDSEERAKNWCHIDLLLDKNIVIKQARIEKKDIEACPEDFFCYPKSTDISYWLHNKQRVKSKMLPKGSLVVKKLTLI